MINDASAFDLPESSEFTKIPYGKLGIIALPGCEELAKKIDSYIVKWRSENLTMKNSLSLKAEYRKQRNLALNVTSVQLTEGHTSEFVIGGGYTIKNLSFTAKNKDGAQKKVSNDLKLQVDVSYKDVKMLLRKIEEGITQASSGNRVLAIKISADYVLSQKINLQLFYDHQGTTPLISSSYPVKADNVGINIKLMLTR
jgi:cell surface protein SprA